MADGDFAAAADKGSTVIAQRAKRSKQYTITASAGPNGSITPSGAVMVASGASQTFVIKPDSGYHVANVLVDGSSAGAVTSYRFTKVTAGHAIAASFAIDCAPSNDCNSARNLGSVSGDIGTDQLTFQGSTSEWFTVRVTENSNTFFDGVPLKVIITLLTPALTNYDLYAYYDPLGDRVVCSPASASSTQQAGISDIVSLAWGEGTAPNGVQDDRTICIEVRHVSGPCTPSDGFALSVQGNK
jgi:hypothetical protein